MNVRSMKRGDLLHTSYVFSSISQIFTLEAHSNKSHYHIVRRWNRGWFKRVRSAWVRETTTWNRAKKARTAKATAWFAHQAYWSCARNRW